MNISPDIFDAYKIYSSKPYEVNTGFIWEVLNLKSENSDKIELYKTLRNAFEDFLIRYQWLLDKNPKEFNFNSLEERDEFQLAIEEHVCFRNHYCDNFQVQKNGLILYCFDNDVYVNLFDYNNVTEPKLDWLFALQLSLIDLIEIADFLDYQFEECFKSDKSKFSKFLKSLIIKYEDESWFGKKYIKRVKLYIAEDLNNILPIPSKSFISEEEEWAEPIIVEDEEEEWVEPTITEDAIFPHCVFLADVMEKHQKEHEENYQKGEEYLNGRNTTELTKDEFDELQKITNNFYLNHFDSKQKQIINNREIYQERRKYLGIYNDRSTIGSDIDTDRWYGLNLHIILREVNYIHKIASKYNAHNFYYHLISHLTFIHDTRKLYIEVEEAKAIANPDEPTMSDQSMYQRGVIFDGQYAYDLNLEVTLDKREYENINLKDAFSFFFALKLSQIDLMHLHSFLDYQLKVTFENDFVKFKAFLNPLLMEYKVIKLNAFFEEEQDLLTTKIEDLVKDWLNDKVLKSFITPSRVQEEQNTEPIPLPPSWLSIPLKKNYTHKDVLIFFSFLYKETGGDPDGKTYMIKKDVEELFKYGLSYPNEAGKGKFVLNRHKSYRNEAVFFYCLSIFRNVFLDYHGNKRDLVTFLIRNFQTFKDENHATLEKNFKNIKPKTFKFKNFESIYLPKKENKNK